MFRRSSLPFRLLLGSLVPLLSFLAAPSKGHAIRPFVTDDARVVGDRLAQLETWLLVNEHAIDHNVLAAIGPLPWLELTAGLTHGGVHSGHDRSYGVTGPLLQAKALLLHAEPGRWPGIAIAGGVLPPVGSGPFERDRRGGFGYLAVSELLFDEHLLFHANVGISGEKDSGATVTAGFGTQAQVLGGFCLIAEIFYVDPYVPVVHEPAMQVGFRHIFSDRVQMDGTFGTLLTEQRHEGGMWGTLGLRVVSKELW